MRVGDVNSQNLQNVLTVDRSGILSTTFVPALFCLMLLVEHTAVLDFMPYEYLHLPIFRSNMHSSLMRLVQRLFKRLHPFACFIFKKQRTSRPPEPFLHTLSHGMEHNCVDLRDGVGMMKHYFRS